MKSESAFSRSLLLVIQNKGLDESSFRRLMREEGVPKQTVSNWLTGKVGRAHSEHLEILERVLQEPRGTFLGTLRVANSLESELSEAFSRPLLRPSVKRLLQKLDEIRTQMQGLIDVPETQERLLTVMLDSVVEAVEVSRESERLSTARTTC